MTTALELINNVLTPLAKSDLVPLGLTAAVSTTVTPIQKKNFGSGTTLIISNEKIVKSLEEPGLLIKGVSETIKNEPKVQKGKFLSMLLVY